MPCYQYQCKNCGHEMEAMQKMSDDPLKKCPECKKNKLQRLISGGACFILKGEGWAGKDLKKKKVYSEHELMSKANKAGRKDIVDKINQNKKDTTIGNSNKNKN